MARLKWLEAFLLIPVVVAATITLVAVALFIGYLGLGVLAFGYLEGIGILGAAVVWVSGALYGGIKIIERIVRNNLAAASPDAGTMGRNANKIDPHDKFSGLATSDYNNKFTITGEPGTKLKGRRWRVLKEVGAFLIIPITVAATITLAGPLIMSRFSFGYTAGSPIVEIGLSSINIVVAGWTLYSNLTFSQDSQKA